MKTAMQKLLDITYNSISNAKELKNNGINDPREIDILLNLYNVYRVIIELDMLEKEKEQIIDAHINGQSDHHFSLESRTLEAEKYYNQTYNQNK